ncbi:hypothetical protein PR003_g25043 [Phytophthora rubi]|uniref:Uncharacterized protein n=1 Tax=Phytophthora rubi TaxID=129364 RepID=A0A6A3IL35_9STRA|nr:hypothetical protein PR002_g23545 [Phytophthora rubi]KAE9291424.1 hypothetical protein PR003_g25043 [Phytophthora rubi]
MCEARAASSEIAAVVGRDPVRTGLAVVLFGCVESQLPSCRRVAASSLGLPLNRWIWGASLPPSSARRPGGDAIAFVLALGSCPAAGGPGPGPLSLSCPMSQSLRVWSRVGPNRECAHS